MNPLPGILKKTYSNHVYRMTKNIRESKAGSVVGSI